MKNLIYILILVICFSCSRQKSSSNQKSFRGELTLTPAESALLYFDRMVELTNSKAEKETLKQTLKNLDLYNKKNTLALFVNANKVVKAKEFIRNHYNEILLEDNNVFVWKSNLKESLLFVKDEYKSIEIGSLVLWIEKIDSITTIKFSPDSKRVLSGFSMKHLNRPILLEINGELVTTVKSFGRLEDGILEIKNR